MAMKRKGASPAKIRATQKAYLAANSQYRKATKKAKAAVRVARKAEVNVANKQVAHLRARGF